MRDRAFNDDETPVSVHRRGPGLWLPVVIFATLLVAAIAVGRFLVPAGGPQAGAAPPTSRAPSPTVTGGTPTPTLSGLPPLPATPARPADALASWAERVGTTVDVPEVAVQAYGYAQLMLAQSDPQCHLTWTTIAGVGEVESL